MICFSPEILQIFAMKYIQVCHSFQKSLFSLNRNCFHLEKSCWNSSGRLWKLSCMWKVYWEYRFIEDITIFCKCILDYHILPLTDFLVSMKDVMPHLLHGLAMKLSIYFKKLEKSLRYFSEVGSWHTMSK